MKSHSSPSRLLLLLLTLVASGIAAGDATTSPSQAESDCGSHALFILLKLTGRDVRFEDILKALPRPHPHGVSMSELQSVAKHLGLSLAGRRLGPADAPLDRPAIAFLRRRNDISGHFVVLNPVGNLGSLVQFIDPPSLPEIVDYDDVFGRSDWTGRILIPKSWRELLWEYLVPVAIVTGLALAIRRVRKMQHPRPRASGD